MPRSLLDGVDVAAVRGAARARPGRAGVVAACLLEGGVLAYAHDEPEWADRDHLVVGSAALRVSFGGPEGEFPAIEADGGRALAVAAGLAAGTLLEGGVSRVFCVLDEDALDDGALWEAALATGAVPLVALLLVGEAAVDRATGVFAAAGWRALPARADEPVEVLGALDRVHQEGQGRPGAVLVICG